MKDNFKVAQDTTKEVVEMLREYGYLNKDVDIYQANTSVLPIISNTFYNRTNELLEAERLRTIIILSKTLDIETATNAIIALGYRISLDKPENK